MKLTVRTFTALVPLAAPVFIPTAAKLRKWEELRKVSGKASVFLQVYCKNPQKVNSSSDNNTNTEYSSEYSSVTDEDVGKRKFHHAAALHDLGIVKRRKKKSKSKSHYASGSINFHGKHPTKLSHHEGYGMGERSVWIVYL